MNDKPILLTPTEAKILMSAYKDLRARRINEYYDLTLLGMEDLFRQLTHEDNIKVAEKLIQAIADSKQEIAPDELPQPTTPDEIELRQLVEDMERKEAARKNIYQASKTSSQPQKLIIPDRPGGQKITRESQIPSEPLYLEPVGLPQEVKLDAVTVVRIATIAKLDIDNTRESQLKLNELLLTNVPQEIKNKYSPEELSTLAQVVAPVIARQSQKFLAKTDTTNITSTKKPLKQPDELILTVPANPSLPSILKYLAEKYPTSAVADYAIASALNDDTARSLSVGFLGIQGTNALFGTHQEVQETNEPTDTSVQVNPKKLVDFAQKVREQLIENIGQVKTRPNSVFDLLRQIEIPKIDLPTTNQLVSPISDLINTFTGSFPAGEVATGAAVGFGAGVAGSPYGVLGYQLYSPQLFTAWKAQAVLQNSLYGKMAVLDMPAFQQTALSMSPIQTYLKGLAAGNFQSEMTGLMFTPANTITFNVPVSVVTATAEGVLTEATSLTGAAAVAASVTTQVLTKVGVSAATAASIGATVGEVTSFVLTPIGGLIVGALTALASWIKANWPKIKKWIEDNAAILSGGLIGSGILLVSAGLVPLGATLVLAGGGIGVGSMGSIGASLSSTAAFFGLILGWMIRKFLEEVGKKTLFTLFTLTIVTGLIIFIINNSAYVVPGSNLSDSPEIPAGETCGENPGCPCGWPIALLTGEQSLPIIQGPYGTLSHTKIEAIDVLAKVGHPISARHNGVVSTFEDGVYGKAVKITSECNGVTFSTIYSHLSVISIASGEVTAGQGIALSGSTGMGEAHLHYEFSPTPTLPMSIPYIPKNVPKSCYGSVQCGVTIP